MTLARYEVGRGPQVVLAHGVGDCAAGFATLIDALQPRFRVTAVDHRGHGHSPRFDADQLTEPFPVLVADFLAELESCQRPLVYGHSMGAAIAAAAAIARPELMAGLVLEDPAWFSRPKDEMGLIGEARVEQVRVDLHDLPAAMRDKIEREKWPAVEAAAWAAGRAQAQPEFLRTGIVASDQRWQDQAAQLADSGVPALVLTGTGQGTILGEAGAQYLDSLGAAQLRTVLVPGAGHCIKRTHPEAVAAALAPVLDELVSA